ncbi:Endomembrane protein 70-domain-containing protein [Helicostylum pulchrum]|nr:Endomembrane protein 70-domain-containing protein [Helicostylum pulchrum]
MLVSILLLIATSEISVVLVFLQLCAEDYIWWWQSFMIGASPAMYMFGYGVYFLVKRTSITGLVGVSVYVLNLVIGCGVVGLCTGTLGFLIFSTRTYDACKKKWPP